MGKAPTIVATSPTLRSKSHVDIRMEASYVSMLFNISMFPEQLDNETFFRYHQRFVFYLNLLSLSPISTEKFALTSNTRKYFSGGVLLPTPH